MLTQNEYQYWVEYVRNNYLHLPDFIVKDISNWRHRSVLARALARAGQYTPAIELFKSIVDITVSGDEEDCIALSEVEDKVWCLKELSIILWRTTGNRSEALMYIKEAITLIATYPQQFNFLDKCEVWREIQDFIFFSVKGKRKCR